MNNLSKDFKDKRAKLCQLLQERSYRNGDFTLSSGKKVRTTSIANLSLLMDMD